MEETKTGKMINWEKIFPKAIEGDDTIHILAAGRQCGKSYSMRKAMEENPALFIEYLYSRRQN